MSLKGTNWAENDESTGALWLASSRIDSVFALTHSDVLFVVLLRCVRTNFPSGAHAPPLERDVDIVAVGIIEFRNSLARLSEYQYYQSHVVRQR
mmetsp:Transcript_545/g.1459  ORF Transcript_545/g.1459 Transcript_545/m.1459 type:complete len:94 (-) Transcript_545:63-344(-)